MSEQSPAARTVVIEKTFPHPPEKLWRALTEPSLLAQWLLRNDFQSKPGHEFQFRNDPMPHWDGVIDGKVLLVDPPHRLSYSWRALGLDSVVLFTLTPAENGTHLRMEHSGFGADQTAAYQGAQYGWQRFLGKLESLLNEEAQ